MPAGVLPPPWASTYAYSLLYTDFTSHISNSGTQASLLWAHTIWKATYPITSTSHLFQLLSGMHHPRPPPLQHNSHAHIFTSMHTDTLFSAGLRSWMISRGATFDGERWISSCMHSLGLLESFCPIRSHWWGLEWCRKWVDNRDHVQITTLSLSQTLRPVTRPFCEESISWI